MQSKTTTFSLLALCALLAGILLWRASAGSAEKKRLEERVATLTRELAAARAPGAPAVSAPPRATQPVNPVTPRQNVEPDRRAVLSLTKANEDLAAARTQVSELESKVLSLEADRAALTQQRQTELAASEEMGRTRIADMQKAADSAQTELKAAQQRAALFESENENLRKAATPKTVVHSAAPAPDGELDELARRRDAYLKSLIRRYREIDTEYRSLLRDPQTGRLDDAAVFRLQGMLAQAEDDLRQIDSLTAKALLVEKKREKN